MTDQNRKDTDKSRPEFDYGKAKEVFDELIKRGLLVECKVDDTGVPAYTMNYDIDGWDKAVSDGQWLRGKWLVLKRNWLLVFITFLATCVVATVENRFVGVLDNWIDAVLPATAEPKPRDIPNVDPQER